MFSFSSLKNPSVFLPLLLILAVVLAYANVYGNAFLFDDEFLIQKNKFLSSFSFLPEIFSSSSTAGFGGVDSFFRPLQIFLYLVVVQFFGLNTAAFHALNVALHAGNAVLVFLLCQRFGLPRAGAFFAALIWALHPVHTEAVTYMSATADPLYSAFMLLGLLLWKLENRKALLQTLACFCLGLLSKETAIVFPALLCVLIFFENEKRWSLKTYLPTWPFWALAALYLLARATVLNFDDSYNFYVEENAYTQNIHLRIFTFFATLVDYARMLFLPLDLRMDRLMAVPTSLFQPKVFPGFMAVLAWLALLGTFFKTKQARFLLPAVFAGAWFLAAYFPKTGILVPMNALILEHWLYMPLIGLIAGAGLCITRITGYGQGVSRELCGALCLLIAGTLGVLTFQQNKVWENPLTFYPHILKYETGSARVYNNLAMAQEEVGRSAEAEETYRKAIAVWDVYPQTHYNLGNLLLKRGDAVEAIWHYQRALELNKNFAYAARMLEQIFRAQGDVTRADEYKKILEDMKR